MPRQSDVLVNQLVAAVEQLGGTVIVDRRDTHREHVELKVRRGPASVAVTVDCWANEPPPLEALRAAFAEINAEGASSNDIVQWLDDFLTSRGLPTVLYA